MNRRVGFLGLALAVAGILTVSGAFSKPSPQATRKVIRLGELSAQFPFSDGILAGNTLYLAGRLGLDPKTGKAPEKIEDEIKNLLEGEKAVLAQAGMTMDDLVYVQVSCTDLSLFDTFNPIYRSARVCRSGVALARSALRTAGDRGETIEVLRSGRNQAL